MQEAIKQQPDGKPSPLQEQALKQLDDGQKKDDADLERLEKILNTPNDSTINSITGQPNGGSQGPLGTTNPLGGVTGGEGPLGSATNALGGATGGGGSLDGATNGLQGLTGGGGPLGGATNSLGGVTGGLGGLTGGLLGGGQGLNVAGIVGLGKSSMS